MDDSGLTAAALARAAGHDLALPPGVVLVFEEALVPRRRRGREAESGPFRRLHDAGDAALVCAAGPGSPSAAVALEFIALFGAERVVTVGRAGDLRSSPDPRIVVVDRAVSDEGTSAHYGDELVAADELTARLLDAVGGIAVASATTDAPLRHSPDHRASLRSRASVVEMECAAVFAAGRALGVDAGALVVISDGFGADGWELADQGAVDRELDAAVRTALAVVAS